MVVFTRKNESEYYQSQKAIIRAVRAKHLFSKVVDFEESTKTTDLADKVLRRTNATPFQHRLAAANHVAKLRKRNPAYSNVFEHFVQGTIGEEMITPQEANRILSPPTQKRRKRKARKHGVVER